MKMKFIKDIQANQSQSIDVPVGNYAGLFVESTALTFPTGTILSTGFDFILDGKTKQTYALPDLIDITNILAGKPTYTITPGAPDDTVEYASLVPFAMPTFQNALLLQRNDEGNLLYRAGNCTGGTLSLYGYIEDAAESYVLNAVKLQETGSGRVLIQIPLKNTLGVFIKPSNVADRIQITVDGNLALDCYGTELLRSTEILHRIEGGTLATGYVDLVPSGSVSELLSDNVRVEFTQAAPGTPTVWAFCVEFNRERASASATEEALRQAKVEAKMIATPFTMPYLNR